MEVSPTTERCISPDIPNEFKGIQPFYVVVSLISCFFSFSSCIRRLRFREDVPGHMISIHGIVGTQSEPLFLVEAMLCVSDAFMY